MERKQLSPLLRRVLDAVGSQAAGVTATTAGEPDPRAVEQLARRLDEDPEVVRQALLGLRAGHCFVEHCVEFEGIEPFVWWTVHPQCVR